MKPIPTPTNVVPALRAMHQRLTEGWPHADDAWWTTEAAAIIERLVKERDDARTEARALEQQLEAAVADHKRLLGEVTAERDAARIEILSDLVTVDRTEYAKQRGWDCLRALEDTAREMYKGGD